MTTPHRTLLQQALEALSNCLSEHGHRCNRCDSEIDEGGKLIAALREAMAAPQPEPVALESVHLTRDTRGMCVVRVNGRVAIRDNGDIIDHMATLEWFAQPAPVPLTDEQFADIVADASIAADLAADPFKLLKFARAIERAHGIAASPAAPAAPVVPLTEGRITGIANELAFGGGHCNVYELARAIEAAHGITGGSK